MKLQDKVEECIYDFDIVDYDDVEHAITSIIITEYEELEPYVYDEDFDISFRMIYEGPNRIGPEFYFSISDSLENKFRELYPELCI